MAVQAFVGSWPRFQFLDLLHSRKDSLDGGTARRKAVTYTQKHKHRINLHNTDIHDLSGIRTHDPSVWAGEDSSCIRTRGRCDQQ
jgi:hypothetical protein